MVLVSFRSLLLGWAVVVLSFNIGFAQQQDFSATSLLSQSSVTQWTSDNVLTSNNITSAIRDRQGFVWFTAYNGIFRFDGVQISGYDKSKIPFLNSDAVYAVYEDHEGSLWFATQTSGIVKFKNNQFEEVDAEHKRLPKSIRCLLVNADGSVWVGSNNSGLFKIVNGIATRIDIAELNDVSILDLATDANHSLWIATDGKGLYKYDDGKLDHIDDIEAPVINSICIPKNSTKVLIGTPNGLDIIEGKKLKHFESLKGLQINKIIADQYNRIWVGAELGLARFRLNDESSFEFIGEKDGFPFSRVTFLFYDNENSLWISTGRDGLLQLRETNIVNITTNQGLSNHKINMVYESADRTFYIGCDGGSIDVYKNGDIKPLKFTTPMKDSGIRDIYEDPNGVLWIASYRGVLKKSKTNERLFGLKDGLTAEDVRRILADNNGDLWFGSRSGGVMKFRNDKVVQVYDKKHGLASNYILDVQKDRANNIYVGTHSGGLSIIRTTGEVQTFHIDRDDAGILIFNIHIDQDNKVWIVANTGIFKFDGEKFEKILLRKELKGEIFFDWVEDLLGNVWLTSTVGVIKIKKTDIEKFLKKEIREVDFKLFDNRDGMQSKECTSATRALLSSRGKIWVPTIHGISVFYPEKTIENKIPPPVYVTSVVVDNKEIKEPNVVEPGKLRYVFNYTATSFVVPKKIKFKYKLDGIDDVWIDAGISRQAEYTNLPPGKYSFRVSACNNDGVWNEHGAVITFEVKPFFYQTSYFYLLIALFTAVLLYLAYKWRVNSIERRNKELRKVNGELDRFVYSASHDLRAPLASILGLVNVARLDKGNNFESYLDKIEKSVTKLDGFIRDIIDFSRNARTEVETELIDFKTLINEVFENLKYLDEKDRIKRIVKVEDQGEFFSDKKRLGVVLNNIIANAIKYSNPHQENPFIEVVVKQNSSFAELNIRDNGIGIAKEHIDHIFKMFYRGDAKSRGSGIGLYIVNETLERIHGTITVKSEYGKGSTFTIIIQSIRPARLRFAKQKEVSNLA